MHSKIYDYFNNNQILRFLSLLFTAIFVLNLCACSNAASGFPNETSESVIMTDLPEISFGFWNIDDMAKQSEHDAVTRFLEEKFGFKAKAISFNWTNYKENYQMLCATNSQPDVFATLTISSNQSNDSATYQDMIESGSIQPLPEDLSAYPHVKELLEKHPYTRYSDGRFYAIPRLSFNDPSLSSSDAAMLVRKDWMKNLNIDTPETIEDFIAMTSSFAKDDPDGNGIDDTFGYNVNSINAIGKWVILGIAPECNVYSWIDTDNGTYEPSWTTENFDRVVSIYRELYDKGALDKNFYTKTPAAVIKDFATGYLGCLEYKSSPAAIQEIEAAWNLYNDLPFNECVDVLPALKAPDGKRYSNSSTLFWSETYISSNVSEEKLDKILKLFDYLLSEEGKMLCKFGIDGTDYTYGENNTYQCLLNTSSETLESLLSKKYPSLSLWADLLTWGGAYTDFEINEENITRYGINSITLANKDLTYNLEHTTQLERPYSFMLFPKETSDVIDQAFNSFIECIIGADDPLTMWHQRLNIFQKEGLDDYILEQNERYQNAEYKINY